MMLSGWEDICESGRK